MLVSVDESTEADEDAQAPAPSTASRLPPGRRAGPDGRLVKRTIAFPTDVLDALEADEAGGGPSVNAEIRRLVTEHVRGRTSDGTIRDPESGGE